MIKRLIKRLIKRNLPAPFLHAIHSYKNREYNNLSTEQIFTRIYEGGGWGKSNDPRNPFYSGSGSHNEVAAYLRSVTPFLRSFAVKPDVVDLGCGDFNVGSQVRIFCNRYVACDVVPSLIDFNKARFQDLDVEFKALDLIEDELPPGDVAFVRQVLQHLSNDQIRKFIARASLNYKFLVVTEHLPSDTDFKHNADKLAGPGTRIRQNSGVVLTSPPFNLRPQTERQLCRISLVDTGFTGVLVTTLYGL